MKEDQGENKEKNTQMNVILRYEWDRNIFTYEKWNLNFLQVIKNYIKKKIIKLR